jgi:hypothetical protein
MSKLMRRLINTILSLITTCLIMVSPVAAMVYATEPATAAESFSIKDSTPAKPVDLYNIDRIMDQQPQKPLHKDSSRQADLTEKK